MRQHIVVDLDGTLCNDGHRAEKHVAIPQPDAMFCDWHDYHNGLSDDEPNDDVLFVMRSVIDSGADVLLVTCRPESYRSQTLDWLVRHDVDYNLLIMRPNGNKTSSELLKIQHLEVYFGSKEEVLRNVIFVLEDRDKVVAGLREYGLRVWQVRPGRY